MTHILTKKYWLGLAVVLLAGGQASAYKPAVTNGRSTPPKSTANFNCAQPSSRAELNINNVRALIHNGGDMWWDLIGSARYEVPKTTDPAQTRLNAMFAGGVWVAGQDPADGTTLVMAQTFRDASSQSFWPGPVDTITAATTKARCQEWDQHFRCEKRTVLQFTFDVTNNVLQVPIPEAQIPEQIRYWPGRNNRFLRSRPGRSISNLDFALARFVDLNGNGDYEPDLGEYPQLPGDDGTSLRDIISSADQCYWFIMNDVGNLKILSNAASNTPAIGMEMHVEAFAYATSDPRNDMTFYRNKLINKGQRTLGQTYFGQWADPDLGNYSDDYVGFDVARGLAYCYNGDDNDEGPLGYGLNPPTVGIDFFIGPQADPNDGLDNDKDCTVDEADEKIIASEFLYYNNVGGTAQDFEANKNGNPGRAVDYYYYLRNNWRNGTPVSYDGQLGLTAVGQVNSNRPQLGPVVRSRFIFPGLSDQSVCWGYEGTCANPCPNGKLPNWDERSAGNPPGDRRFLISAGPFTLVPGASNQLTVSVIWARASSGGALGSYGKLLVADDLSQQLFDRDFKILLGPNEPKVDITELDGELLLTITPDVFQGQSTEEYSITDPNLNPLYGDVDYKFEGYVVYQLRDATVGTSDLNDPNKAQVVAQFDVKNGVGTIYNREFDPLVNERLPVLKVTGGDQGIRNVVRIRQDKFNPEREKLVNFKKYYYRVVTYAYNNNSQNNEPFLLGFPRVDPVTGNLIDRIEAIPHKVDPERSGTVVRSDFDQGIDITRVFGSGSGGRKVNSLKPADVNVIVRQGSKQEITYDGSGAPVKVTVYNPKLVKSGNFEMNLYSRLIYNPQASSYTFQPGDTVISLWEPSTIPALGIGGGFNRQLLDTTNRRAAIAVVKTILTPAPDSVELIVETLNDAQRGTFTQSVGVYSCENSQCSETRFRSYITVPFDFVKYFPSTDTRVAGQRGRLRRFYDYDYWTLRETNDNFEVASRRSVRLAQEQLVPQYGISVLVANTVEPGYQPQVNRNVGFPEATLQFADPNNAWYLGVPNLLLGPHDNRNSRSWLLDDRTGGSGSNADYTYADYLASDPGLFYTRLLPAPYFDPQGGSLQQGGRVAPWYATAFGGNNGPGPRRPVNTARGGANDFRNLRNVDLVFTTDTSLWTEVVVFQHDTLTGNPIVANMFQKSRFPSRAKNGNILNQPSPYTGPRNPTAPAPISRGRTWFPGYAIDLDRGIRLNMAFSESYLVYGNYINAGPDGKQNPGNDLIFDFNTTSLATGATTTNKHFVYVMTSQYDVNNGARAIEKTLDSLYYTTNANLPVARRTQAINAFFDREMMWVAYPSVREGASRDNDATINFRIARPFTAYPAGPPVAANRAPLYRFTTAGLSTLTFNKERGTNALDLIRVVPNPYYAYNEDANSQIDARIKIVNIPSAATISVFSLSGTLVRQFNVDFRNVPGQNQTTFVEWDLKNQVGIPVASGTYIIHIDGKELGEKVVKFFGVMRPIDLDGIRLN